MPQSDTEAVSETSLLRYSLIPLELITSTEEIDPHHVEEVTRRLRIQKRVKPIVLQKEFFQEEVFNLLDGNHRLAALKRLEYRKAPAYVLNTPASVFHNGNRNVIVEVDSVRYSCFLDQVKHYVYTGVGGHFARRPRLPEPVIRYLTREIPLAELA